MRIRFATGCLAAVALAWSLGMTGCCCQRKGLVLRGDWSFELNRVQHMRSNGPTYAGDACTMPCDDYSCTSGSCSDGNCISCRSGAGAGNGAGASYGGPHGGRGDYYEGGAGGAGGYDAGPHVPPPPQPTPAAQSRFHPVPTRPVFEPQQSMAEVPVDSRGAENAGASSRRPTEQRRTSARSPDAGGSARGNRLAENAGLSPIEEADVELTSAELPADQPATQPDGTEIASTGATAPERTPSESAWRVKARRS